ncbi:MAG: class I SAM-dependent methyltransferase [Candidatus Ranarchaeia archaeon]
MRGPDYYKTRSKAAFDKDAKKYDALRYKYSKGLYKHVVNILTAKSFRSLLDVGVGTGELISILLKEKEFLAAGIDISPEMIKVASKKLPETVDLRVGASDLLEWPENHFDVVMSLYCFHHFPEPEKVLREMYRVMKAGGTLLIGDVLALPGIRRIVNFILSHSSRSGDARMYSEEEMLGYVTKAGFRQAKYKKIGLGTYLLVAEKP